MQPNEPLVRKVVPSPASGFTIERAPATNIRTAEEDTAILLTPNTPLYVAGILIRRPSDFAFSSMNYAHLDEGGRPTDVHPQWAQVFWRLPDESQYTVPHRYVFAWHARNEEQIVWIFQVIDQIAFHMGNRDVQRRVGLGDLPVTLLLLTESY